ncbi:phosphate acetyltransferase [Pedococcus sp. KACC 23699]|uniref:Phosphate acetyltransferase n=1 Tax=Pedococcus sp. KACC 23699 TaxID=3149228 RepID=A0AAU7JSM7_9MICO
MVTSIYIAGTEAQSGKSAVAVGLLDQLSRRTGRVGVFRPIVRASAPDVLLLTLLSQLPGDQTVEQACGVTYDDLHASPERAMGTIVDRFHEVARDHDVVLVVGSDYTDVAAPTEFSVNAAVAANLGSRLLLVVPAQGHDPGEVATSAEMAANAARDAHAHVTGVVANRVDPDLLEATASAVSSRVGVPVQALPETPLLRSPTVKDLMDACTGHLVHGSTGWLDRECTSLLVAAMTMPHVLDRLVEGCVVIVPGDREDVVLGVLLAHRSRTFPALSGIVLNGGFPLTPQVQRLIEGLEVELPVIATQGGTMTTATLLGAARGRLTPESTRKLEAAVAMVERGLDAEALLGPVGAAGEGTVTPLMFEHRLVDDARVAHAHIVLPEGAEDRILLAADTVLGRGIARLTLLGNPESIRANAARLGVDVSAATVIDPTTSDLREGFAAEYAALRAHKGVTVDQARDRVVDPSYFGTMMVHQGLADGMVAGCITTTAHTIRPALEIVRTAPEVSVVSSVFLMCLADRVLVYGDCAVNPDPTAEQLADIAISSARTALRFGIEPRVAMLSYSTGESGTGADVDKVRTATALVHERAPELLVEGPIQYDAAVDLGVAATKIKDSPVAGRATVLVFPDLNTGNNTYKAVQRSASAVAIGPVLQGLNRPVNDLSRGALVRDIVNTIAITAIQAGT